MDGIEAILGELVEMAQATAPALWAIAQRQVLAQRVGFAVWGALFFLASVLLVIAARYCKRRAGDYDLWVAGTVYSSIFACFALVGALAYLNQVIVYSINPDYYAIKVLIGLVQR